MSDLVELLRDPAEKYSVNLYPKAADEIERNREAIAELVQALKPFADAYESWNGGTAREHFSASVTPGDYHNAYLIVKNATKETK